MIIGPSLVARITSKSRIQVKGIFFFFFFFFFYNFPCKSCGGGNLQDITSVCHSGTVRRNCSKGSPSHVIPGMLAKKRRYMKRQRAAGSKAPFISGKTLKVGGVGGGWGGYANQRGCTPY